MAIVDLAYPLTDATPANWPGISIASIPATYASANPFQPLVPNYLVRSGGGVTATYDPFILNNGVWSGTASSGPCIGTPKFLASWACSVQIAFIFLSDDGGGNLANTDILKFDFGGNTPVTILATGGPLSTTLDFKMKVEGLPPVNEYTLSKQGEYPGNWHVLRFQYIMESERLGILRNPPFVGCCIFGHDRTTVTNLTFGGGLGEPLSEDFQNSVSAGPSVGLRAIVFNSGVGRTVGFSCLAISYSDASPSVIRGPTLLLGGDDCPAGLFIEETPFQSFDPKSILPLCYQLSPPFPNPQDPRTPCVDQSALFRDDFEGGAPLTANYVEISGVSLGTGNGIPTVAEPLGTDGLANASLGTLATAPGGSFLSPIPNPKLFAFGGFWKWNNFTTVRHYWAQLRFDTTVIISFWIEDVPLGTGGFPADIVIYEGDTPGPSFEIARASAAIANMADFFQLEVKGTLSSSLTSFDGEVTVRLNGTTLLTVTGSDKIGLGPGGVWNNIKIGTIGDFDDLYVTNGYFCNQAPGGPGEGSGVCCSTQGGFDQTPGDNNDPVICPPGGADPSFEACAGDGVGPVGSDPTDPQLMTNVVTPLVFMELTLPDTTVLRLAQQSLGTPAAAFRQGRINNIAPLAQVLSDLYGRMSSVSSTVRFSDTDRVFRGYADSTTNRFLKNSTAVFFIEGDTARRAGTAPLVLGSTIAKKFTPGPNFTFSLELVDELSSKQSPTSVDRPLPDVNVAEVFPGVPENLRNIPLPFYYGQYSDDDKVLESPERKPQGIVPVIGPIRTELLSDGNEWDLYVVCRFAVKEISSWFASNLNEEGAGTVRMEQGTEGEDFLIPGMSGWEDVIGFNQNFLDETAPDGTVYRLTVIYCRGDRAAAHNSGGPTIRVNLCGIESNGDGTGLVIDQAAEVAYHFWNYIVLSRVTNPSGGAWPAVPIDVLGTPKVNRTSVETLNALHLVRVPTIGYEVAWAIRERRSIRAYWQEFQTGTQIRVGRDRHQIVFSDLDDEADVAALFAFDHSNMIDGSLRLDPGSDEIINKLSYESGPEAASGRFTNGPKIMTDTGSISDYGDTFEAPDVQLHPVRNAAVADDVISRKLLRFRNEPMYGTFETGIAGLDRSLGELVRVTNEEGLGLTGWTDHVVLITGIKTFPNISGREMKCLMSFEDVHRILVDQQVDWNPCGNEGDASASIVGLESGGTANRCGSG